MPLAMLGDSMKRRYCCGSSGRSMIGIRYEEGRAGVDLGCGIGKGENKGFCQLFSAVLVTK